MDSVIAILIFVVIAFAAALGILPLQSRRQRRELQKTPDEEWAESEFSTLSRGEFELCRILPAGKWTVAEYTFQDEARHDFGRYDGANRVRAEVHYAGGTAGLYIQRTPLGGTAFAGKVKASSSASIVLRNDDRVLAEVVPSLTRQEANLEVHWQQRKILIERPRWRVFNRGVMTENGQTIGEFRRAPGVSRKILVAFRRQVPEELRVVLCCLTLLQ